jgi:hypothetical protein
VNYRQKSFIRLVPGVVSLVVQLAGRVDDEGAVAERHLAAVLDNVEGVWKIGVLDYAHITIINGDSRVVRLIVQIEQGILDTNVGKQLSVGATDV